MTITIDQLDLSHSDWLAAERTLYSKSLYDFVKAAWSILEPGRAFIPSWHIEAICQHLEAVSAGSITRLCISVPPGFMKSLLVAVFFNAWVWTHSPHKRFLSSGSSEAFCERDNGKLRTLINSPWYQSLWPMTFPQTDTLLRFENDSTGFRWAKSYSSLTGGRGNFLLLDDVLPVDDANSETERAKVNRRFFEQATSRLETMDDAIIIIMQRVHESDLIGEIMERQRIKGQDLGFEFLTIPMEYEGEPNETSIGWSDPRTELGELICPAYRNRVWTEREKATIGSYGWASQYMQSPTPRGDGFFDVDKFKLYEPDQLPINLNCYLASDHAEGFANGDWNVIQVWGVDQDSNFYLLDQYRERLPILDALGIETREGKLALAQRGALPMIRRHKVLRWFADADGLIRSHLRTIQDAMKATRAHCAVEVVPQGRANKVQRAASLQSWSNLGKVFVPAGRIGDTFLAEVRSFPTGRHDDQIDAAGLLPRMMDYHPAMVPPAGAPGSNPTDYRGGRQPRGAQQHLY